MSVVFSSILKVHMPIDFAWCYDSYSALIFLLLLCMTLSELTCDAAVEVTGGHLMNTVQSETLWKT